MLDQWLNADNVAKLEGVSTSSIWKRIQRGKYPEALLRKQSRESGGYFYEIHATALSENAKAQLTQFENVQTEETVPEIEPERKERSDKGTTSADDHILFRCARIIENKKASFHGKLKRNFGYKEGYEKFCEYSKAEGTKIVSYRRFIDLVKPLVDKEIQTKKTLGPTRYRNTQEMVLRHDYSGYESMQMLQNDHTQFDCVCVWNGKIIRPWAAFHNSPGDRILSYPTIVERPDSYSLADNLSNFVQKFGLSKLPVIYKSDNGKAQVSRLMTNNGIEEEEIKAFDIEEHHLKVLRLMNLGSSFEKGMIQNLGMIEHHSTPKLARTKIIERQFGIGGTMEWFKDRPEYTGRRYQEQPEKLSKEIKRGNIWHADEMVDYIINKVDEYNARFHQGIKDECSGVYAVPHIYNLKVEYFQQSKKAIKLFGGLIPEAMSEVYRILNNPDWSKKALGVELYSPLWRRRVFELCGWQSRAIPAAETMAMLAMKAEIRTVHKFGISINSNLYINYALKPYIGKKVVCRYSPDNLIRIEEQSGKKKLYIEQLYIFDEKTEQFICIAEPHPRTVTGYQPQGYAKSFLSIRGREEKKITSAAKISTQYAEGKEQELERSTPIFQMQSPRDQAAKNMKEAQAQKRKQKEVDAAQNQLDKAHLVALYGNQIEE